MPSAEINDISYESQAGFHWKLVELENDNSLDLVLGFFGFLDFFFASF